VFHSTCHSFTQLFGWESERPQEFCCQRGECARVQSYDFRQTIGKHVGDFDLGNYSHLALKKFGNLVLKKIVNIFVKKNILHKSDHRVSIFYKL
jgi:hypothetical protein